MASDAPLTAISLFSGIGGIDLAMERAGIRVTAMCEIDKACREVLHRHWPDIPVLHDVKDVSYDVIPGCYDILTAGWPCQGNSVAGRRKGMEDPRSGLWSEVARMLGELRPKWFIGENVPGLLSVNGGRDLLAVLRSLDELGYGVAWRVLDAQYFGVPQRRRRVIIVGCLGDPAGAAEVLFDIEGGAGDPAPRPEAGTRVAGTLASSAGGGGLGGAGQSANSITSRIVETVSTLQGGGRRGYRVDAEAAAGGHLIAAALTARCGKGVDSDANGVVAVPVAVRGRSRTAPPLTARHGDPGSIASGLAVRRLTPLECTRLQGFPDEWLEISDADATQAHAGQILRELWMSAGTKAREGWRPGIASALFTPEVLLAGVYGGWIPWSLAAECAAARGALSGQEPWPEGFVRELWRNAEARPSPHRLESFEQLARELDRSLPELPLEGAQIRAFLLGSRLWPQASQERPLRHALAAGEARSPAHLSDAARYRQLGNAVAVPVLEWVMRRLVNSHGGSSGA